MDKLRLFEEEILKEKEVPTLWPGDTVNVHIKITEGKRERIQVFSGIVISRRGSGINKTFTVRKESYGVGVEKIFPLYSPSIEKIEVVSHGVVRRSKLYYLRGRRGKSARIKKKIT